jgi:branched-chain amino acid transport system substrate-binding protein
MPSPRRAFVGFVALAVLLAACGGGGSDDQDSASSTTSSSTTKSASAQDSNVDGTLVLGQLAPLTGELASISKSLTAPVQIAVNEVNAAGGFNGKPVGLAVADAGGATAPTVARDSLRTLLDTNGVDAVIGPPSSGTTLELLDTIRRSATLQCSGSNSAPELSAANSGGYYFRTAPPDRLQALALARIVVAEGRRRPAVVIRNDSYGNAFARGLVPELKRGGAKLAGPLIRYNPAAPDLARVAARVKAANPDSVVAIASVDDGARLLKAMVAAGVGPNQLPMYTADGMQSMSLAASVDPATPRLLQGISGTAPAAAPAGIASPFADALRRAGVLPIFSAYYYDCTILTALAAVQAGSDDPAKMKTAFAKSLRGSTDCTTFTACVQALNAGQTIHYRGASSRFDRWDRFEPGEGVYDRWAYGGDGRVVTAPPQSQLHVP